MPAVQAASPKPVAAYVADTHFCHTPPASRGETRQQWYARQSDYIAQLKRIAGWLPVFVAGDLLDRWDSPPELVNFLIDEMPHVYAVAGNHDLPNHNYGYIDRSAYWTLVRAGKVTDLPPGKEVPIIGQTLDFTVTGFPCGFAGDKTPRKKLAEGSRHLLRVALVHDFVWDASKSHTGFPGAPLNKDMFQHAKDFHDFNVVLMGDNHKQIVATMSNGQTIANAGAFMCRTIDERHRTPQVGILYSDGSILWQDINTSKDIWLDRVPDNTELPSAEELMEVLRKLGDVTLNFQKAVRDYVRAHDTPRAVRLMLNEIMDAKELQ